MLRSRPATIVSSVPLRALSASVLPAGAEVTEIVLDVLTWIVVALLCLVLYRLHQIYARRRLGYREIRQDDHVLYSRSLMGTKDSWETIPVAPATTAAATDRPV